MSERDSVNSTSRVSRRSFFSQVGIFAMALMGGPAWALRPVAAKWDSSKELLVSLSIASFDDRRARRPYVAVWIEDDKGKMVRTLAVWIQQGQKGSRWYPDLKRWYRAASEFFDSSKIDLIETVSTATKAAGDYKLIWDGKDDKKNFVSQGKYYVCIEAAREHGTYQLIRKDVTLGTKTLTQKLDGNVEITSASLEYRKKS